MSEKLMGQTVGCTCNMTMKRGIGWVHHPSCATQQWQPGHLNTQTAQRMRNLPTPAERFGQHVTEKAMDPSMDPERRWYDEPLKTREQLEKEAAAQAAKLDAFLKQHTIPAIKLPAKEADALPNGKAARLDFSALAEPLDPRFKRGRLNTLKFPAASLPHHLGGGPTRVTTFPQSAEGRKQYPIATGVLDYFPDAIAAIAYVSYLSNEQHNPGQPVHWARGKSMDHDDTLMRHFSQRGTKDTDGIRHRAKVAWRALAALQEEIESEMAEEEGAA
jgi:hypothetical protein